MKKLLSLFILASMIICLFPFPANAKSDSKTKVLTMYLSKEGRGVEVSCSVPYYNKWNLLSDKVYGEHAYLKTSKGNVINIMVLKAEDDANAKLCCKYLSNKKYKKRFLEYLTKEFKAPDLDAASVFKIIKDGQGKYMLVVNMGSQYGVIRVLDSEHIIIYNIETKGEKISNSVKKKIISYSRQITFEKKSAGIDTGHEKDINVKILDVELDADKVIFSSVYSNMAWGFQKRAMYILGDGRVYSYDFTDNPGNIKGDLSEENILEYLKKTKAVAVVDKDYLLKMYSYAVHIDPDAKYTTKYVMCDSGQTKYYFYAEDGSKVVFASDGDVKYIYNDEYANEVEKLWENLDLHCK